MSSAYFEAIFHVLILNVFLLAAASATRLAQLTKAAQQTSHAPKLVADGDTPESPRYADSVTLVERDIDGKAKQSKKAKGAVERLQDIPEAFPHLCNPVVMLAHTPSANILDDLEKPLPRPSSTFTRKQRLPIPSFIPPEDEASASASTNLVKPPVPVGGKEEVLKRAALRKAQAAALKSSKIGSKDTLPPPSSADAAPPSARQKLGKIFSGLKVLSPLRRRLSKETPRGQDIPGRQQPSTMSRKTLKSSRASSITQVSSSRANHSDQASHGLGPPIQLLSKVTRDPRKENCIMEWEIIDSDAVLPPTPSPVQTRRPESKVTAPKPIDQLQEKPKRARAPVVESALELLARIRARRASAQNAAATVVDDLNKKPSQSRFAKLVDKLASEPLKTESRLKSKVPVAMVRTPVDEPVSIPKQSAAQPPLAHALRRVSTKVSDVVKPSRKSENPEKIASAKGLKVPANASAPPTRKDAESQPSSAPPPRRRSAPLSDFVLPPSMVNVSREHPASHRVRLIPMKPKPPVWSPPRKVVDIFFSPRDEKKKVHELPAGGLFGVGSPDRRHIRKLDERDYFITSTPRVNHAHYGGFSTSTPRPGVNTQRDTWHDFF